MKLFHLRPRGTNNSGIILVTVLWILVILSILAISLGRSTRVDLSLTKYAIGKIKAKYLAVAGVVSVIDKIRYYATPDAPVPLAALYQGGHADEAMVEALFHQDLSPEGIFEVQYQQPSLEATVSTGRVRGIQDEERKININALSRSNINIFIEFLKVLGSSDDEARTMAFSTLDWKDPDTARSDAVHGAEDDYYQTLTPRYKAKNSHFDSKMELTLVRGISRDFFHQMEGYISVFPKEARSFRVNFNTASAPVLQALARSVSGPITNTTRDDADALVTKLIAFRRGEDGQDFTQDDRLIAVNQMPLNNSEKAIFLTILKYNAINPNYLNIQIQAVASYQAMESHIEAIVQRDNLKVVYWHRD